MSLVRWRDILIRSYEPAARSSQLTFFDFFWLLIWTYLFFAYLMVMFQIIGDLFREFHNEFGVVCKISHAQVQATAEPKRELTFDEYNVPTAPHVALVARRYRRRTRLFTNEVGQSFARCVS